MNHDAASASIASWHASLGISLLALLAGCSVSHPLPPERPSPLLVPSGESALFAEQPGGDGRRGGVVSVRAGEWRTDVGHIDAAGVTPFFSIEAVAGAYTMSRHDGAVAAMTRDYRLHFFDGTSVTDLTPRLRAALVSGNSSSILRVDSFDVRDDGALAAGVLPVNGADGGRPQLCVLSPEGDHCVDVGELAADPDARFFGPTYVTVEGDRTYIIVDHGLLHVRTGSGSWTPVSAEPIQYVFPLGEGRVGYYAYGLHVVSPDGSEVFHEGIFGFSGHSAENMWDVTYECADEHWGIAVGDPCDPEGPWTQLVVRHFDGVTETEVGHLTSSPGDELHAYVHVLLADGTLRLEIAGEVYLIPPPAR